MKVPPIVLSLMVHGAVLLAMSRLPEAQARKANTIVEMKVTQTKREPPPPPPPPEVIPPPQVEPKKVKVRTAKEIVKEAPPPPPPEAPPPPPKLSFSVDMESTVEGGGVAVPAIEGGGNMFADPDKDAALPAGKSTTPHVEPGTGKGGPSDGYQITEPPRFLTPESERAPPYPRVARSKEIEGKVLLRVYVAEDGTVKQVEVLQRLGGGCTEAAVKWAKTKWRFEAARAGEEPIGMWITVPVRFVLDR